MLRYFNFEYIFSIDDSSNNGPYKNKLRGPDEDTFFS